MRIVLKPLASLYKPKIDKIRMISFVYTMHSVVFSAVCRESGDVRVWTPIVKGGFHPGKHISRLELFSSYLKNKDRAHTTDTETTSVPFVVKIYMNKLHRTT